MAQARYVIPLFTEVSAELDSGTLKTHVKMKPHVTVPLTLVLALACALGAVSLSDVFIPVLFQLALTFFYWVTAVEKVSR